MPFLADGTPVDIMLNPLGVPSRMNLGVTDELVAVAVRERRGQQALEGLLAHAVEHRGGHRGARLALLGALRHVLLPLRLEVGVERDVPAGVRDPAEGRDRRQGDHTRRRRRGRRRAAERREPDDPRLHRPAPQDHAGRQALGPPRQQGRHRRTAAPCRCHRRACCRRGP